MKNSKIFLTISILLSILMVNAYAGNEIFWSQTNTVDKIERSDWNGMNIATVHSSLKANDVAVDPRPNGKLYWAQRTPPSIVRSDRDGSNIQILVDSSVLGPSSIQFGLALDVASNKMYWTDAFTGNIYRANLDGTSLQILHTVGIIGNIADIALDLNAGKMYYILQGSGTIERANLNGTGVQTIVTGLGALSNPPVGIAVDSVNGNLYWTDGEFVMRSTLNGTGITTIATVSNLDQVLDDIEVDPELGHIYFADGSSPNIYRADLAGGGLQVFISGLINPQFLGLDPTICRTFQATYGTPTERETGFFGIEADNEQIVMVGTKVALAGTNDVLMLNTTEEGYPNWEKRYGNIGNEEGLAVRETRDNNFIVTGYTDSFGFGNKDLLLMKVDPNGNLIWAFLYGSQFDDRGNFVIQTSDDGFVACGRSFDGAKDNVFVVKVQANGTLDWAHRYDVDLESEGWSLEQNKDKGYIVSGRVRKLDEADILLMRLDSSGLPIWARSYRGDKSEIGYSVKIKTVNEFAVAGTTNSYGTGNDDMILVRVTSNGSLIQATTYGFKGNDVARALQVTPDKGFAMSGTTRGPNPILPFLRPNRAWLVKTDGTGNVEFSATYGHKLVNSPISSLDLVKKGGYLLGGNAVVDPGTKVDFVAIKPDLRGITKYVFDNPLGGFTDRNCDRFVRPKTQDVITPTLIHSATVSPIPNAQNITALWNAVNDDLPYKFTCKGCFQCPFKLSKSVDVGLDLDVLYEFRDNVLRNSKLGEQLIDDFYAVSPAVTKVLIDDQQLQNEFTALAKNTIDLVSKFGKNPTKSMPLVVRTLTGGKKVVNDIHKRLDKENQAVLQFWVNFFNKPSDLIKELITPSKPVKRPVDTGTKKSTTKSVDEPVNGKSK